MGDLIEPAV
jgi:hypothetical protein